MQNTLNLLKIFSKNKKLFLAAFLPFAFWIGIFAFWFYGTNQTNAEPSTIKQSKETASGPSMSQIATIGSHIDSDNDGLSDWEESVYGTNSSNPDSDGDGYLDGEEIISGRDPLIKGPDDLIIPKNAKNTLEKSTITEKLSKQVIENYLKTIQSQGYQNISPEQLSQILSEAFSADETSTQSFNESLKASLYYFIPPNLDKEIKISKDNSEKNIKNYWLAINKSFSEMIKNAPAVDLLNAIASGMKTKDYSQLNEAITYYKNNYENVKTITVPSSLAPTHKNMLTIFYKHWKISEAIKNYEQDPALTLLALNEFANLTKQTNSSR